MLVAGIDEAGRGSLISRVYTAAVILPDDFIEHALADGIVIRDSKKMSHSQKARARAYIETHAIAFSVGYAERDEIDSVNILQATMNAMHRSIRGLQIPPDLLRVDGSYFVPYRDEYAHEIPHECVIRGDDTDPAIACASILAKTYRDEYMLQVVNEHPFLERYGIVHNMGYGTKDHIEALKRYGPSLLHRRSFHVKKAQRRLLINRISQNAYEDTEEVVDNGISYPI